MKSLLKILSIVLLCGVVSCPPIEARGRNNNSSGNQNTSTQQAPNRNTGNNNNQRPGNNTSTGRPGNSSSTDRPGNSTSVGRPGNNGHGNNAGNVGTNNHRPNSSHGQSSGNNRPNSNSNIHYPAHQPDNRPVHNFGPGNQPGANRPPSVSHIPQYAPTRPMMLPPRPFARPVPPPTFRLGPRYPVIRTILGVTLGTAINASLNYLFNQGYYITGYTNDAVYLNDVMQMNQFWSDATLYYTHGRLAGSEFVNSTPYYDTTQYYSTLNSLNSAYGLPALQNMIPGGGMECSWFGYNGQYVTLQFMPGVAANGTSRFYTTLSFGN